MQENLREKDGSTAAIEKLFLGAQETYHESQKRTEDESKVFRMPYAYLEALYYKIPMLLTHTSGIEYFIKRGDCTCGLQGYPDIFANMLLEKIFLLSPQKTGNDYPFLLTKCIKKYEKLYRNFSEAVPKN
jgi:hypothetical protein